MTIQSQCQWCMQVKKSHLFRWWLSPIQCKAIIEIIVDPQNSWIFHGQYWYHMFSTSVSGSSGNGTAGSCSARASASRASSSSKLLNNTIQNKIYSSSHKYDFYEEVCITRLDVYGSCFPPICSFNALCSIGAIHCHRTGSTLAQIMAFCPTTLSHYLNKIWLIIH